MDEIIIRSLRGEATPREMEKLHAWRDASLVNERRYRDVVWVWNATSAATEQTSYAPSADELLAGRPQARWGVEWARRGLIAAVLATVAFGISTLLPRQVGGPTFGAAEFVTGPGEMVTANLSDGSVVRLAPESRLRFRGTPTAREAWLEGRAFFAVAKHPSLRFRVQTRAGETLVLGTRFDVTAREDDMRVVVVEGRVQLSAGGSRVEVGAGEVSEISNGSDPSVIRMADVHGLLDWMNGFLVFQDTPMREVAHEVERRYGLEINIRDEALADRTVTAWFADRSPEQVMAVICRVIDAECLLSDSVVSIGR